MLAINLLRPPGRRLVRLRQWFAHWNHGDQLPL